MLELPDVLLVLATVDNPSVAADGQPCRVDDVGFPVALQLVPEDFPRCAACSGMLLEESNERVEVAVGNEKVRVREEDELACCCLDACVDRRAEPCPVCELEHPHPRIS